MLILILLFCSTPSVENKNIDRDFLKNIKLEKAEANGVLKHKSQHSEDFHYEPSRLFNTLHLKTNVHVGTSDKPSPNKSQFINT